MEAARAATRFGTTGYFTLTMWSCIALLHELRGERAAADRLVARLEAEIDRRHADRPGDPLLSRLSAHRGSGGAFARIESSASSSAGNGMGLILEAGSDVTAELGRSSSRRATVADSPCIQRLGRSSRRCPSTPTASTAALRSRAATVSRALETLARASDSCGALGAAWEAAVAQVWLGEAQLAAGGAGGGGASRRKRSTSSTTSAPFASAESAP